MLIGKLLDPKNDYVFKRIFGYVGNEEITKGLLNSILDTKVEDITLDCKEILEKDLSEDKFGILDVKAKINNGIECDIEMQFGDNKAIEERLLFYWSSMYTKQIKTGGRYIDLKKTIVILFSGKELKNLKNIEDYFTKWSIREKKHKECELTNNLEIYIIELPKFTEDISKKDELDEWVKFIKNPEVVDMSEENNNEALKKAKDVLEQISQDEIEQEMAFRRELYQMDKISLEAGIKERLQEEAREEGREEGLQKGIEEGKKEGKEETIKETAKKMIEKDIPIEIIIEITGLTKEEIEKLK